MDCGWEKGPNWGFVGGEETKKSGGDVTEKGVYNINNKGGSFGRNRGGWRCGPWWGKWGEVEF